MDVIELDRVIGCKRSPVAPRPPNRDPRVIEVMDEVMCEAIAGGLTNPNAYRAVKHLAAVVNAAIADLVAASLLGCLIANAGLADL